ncbi:MAG: transcription antitermination factor NusB [Firmicutes bacterium]|nr:transcription antitermination factor NusB [Bacillota bacterium]
MTEIGKIRTFPLPQPAEDKPLRKTAKPVAKTEAPELADEELAAKFATMNKEDYRDLSQSPRRRAREAALLLSFQMDMGGESWHLAARVLTDIGLSEDGAAFALQLAQSAAADQEKYDQLINEFAREWTVERFAAIDRNILRLAIAELLHDQDGANANIIINEAIELAKKFGDENSGSLVNGILDAIRIKELTVPPAEDAPQ